MLISIFDDRLQNQPRHEEIGNITFELDLNTVSVTYGLHVYIRARMIDLQPQRNIILVIASNELKILSDVQAELISLFLLILGFN
ncbi:hypothetical protein D3C71_1185740 [compost metagenome]